MSNRALIVKCSHCKQILATRDFDGHTCDIPINGVKEIQVVYFRDNSYGDKKIIVGRGIDGVLYNFHVVPRKPIPCVSRLSDGNLHPSKSDKDFTESYPAHESLIVSWLITEFG